MAKRAKRKGSKVKAKKLKSKKVKAKKLKAKTTKKAARKRAARIPSGAASAPPGPGPLYPCRCFKVGNKYQKWVLDASTGTYRGPYDCTRQECLACNRSKAVARR